jgi:glycosyltransferase involved in cell wall biosynthesis
MGLETQCLVITSNATLDVGGEVIFATGLANELKARNGIRSTLLIRNELKGAEIVNLENRKHRLPRIVNPILIVLDILLFTVIAVPVALGFIRRVRRKRQNVILLAHDGTFSGIVGIIVGRLSRAPVVVTFHGTHILSAYYIFNTMSRVASIVATHLSKFCLEHANKIIAIDPKTRSCLMFETKTSRDIMLIPTFCRDLTYKPQTVEQKLAPLFPRDSKLIGYVGRLSPEKNVLDTVKAFKEVSKVRSDALLVIVGDGELRDKIVQLSKEEGIEDRVLLLGYRSDVGAVMRRLTCLVLASKSEGFPQVILEAWSFGVTVVASDRIPFLENGKNALTFPPDDVAKQKEAILEILSNPEFAKKLSKNAKKTLLEFSKETVAEKYYSVFLNALEECV